MAYLAPFTEPLRTESFRFNRRWLQSQAERVGDLRSPQFNTGRELNLPPQYLLVHRVTMGTLGVLCQLDADVPLRGIVQRWQPSIFEPEPGTERSSGSAGPAPGSATQGDVRDHVTCARAGRARGARRRPGRVPGRRRFGRRRPMRRRGPGRDGAAHPRWAGARLPCVGDRPVAIPVAGRRRRGAGVARGRTTAWVGAHVRTRGRSRG